VWGLQVPEDRIPETIEMSLDDADQVAAVHRVARAAWMADFDLNALALWLSSSVGDDSKTRMIRLRTD
jgi:hypothetical protein